MIVFPWLASLLLAAHFLRGFGLGPALAAAALPLLLFVPQRWAPRVVGALLLAGALEWLRTLVELATLRVELGAPWLRMAAILGAVALFTAFAGWVALRREGLPRYAGADQHTGLSITVFAAVTLLLAWLRWKLEIELLILDRFLPGFGWIEILALSAYGAFLTDRLRRPSTQARWRARAWRIFSFVFFTQLTLGLLGFERFLMTGELHLPVPALIAAGPLYRGEGLFMLGLFLSTVVLVGPAWCSHLCYIGAWDDAFARRKKWAGGRPREGLRATIALLVIGSAIGLRLLGASWVAAASVAAAFGLFGVGVMAFASRRQGSMVHCTLYCPIGLFATRLGKLSPWRLRIEPSACTECMLCARVCRFGALDLPQLRAGRPASTCTLCTDCITECPKNTISLRLPFISASSAHDAFVVSVTTLHVVFLGVARI